MNKILVICGPTATGKTRLAIQLAKEYNAELVSVDSRQVYKGMDIGTGKDISLASRNQKTEARDVLFKNITFKIFPYDFNGIPLWMYDVVNPDEEFSASHYAHLAKAIIADIQRRNKLPILVGGTGLYVKAILEDIETIDIPRNVALRTELEVKSVPELQTILHNKSHKMWEKLNHSDKNNPRRLIRKIEIVSSSSSVSQGTLDVEGSKERLYDSLTIGLKTDLITLEQNISLRVQERVNQGIIPEIEQLLSLGYSWNLPSLNTFGYKEWKQYLDNPSEITKQQAITDWIHDEISYVKKQLTWFKKQEEIRWFDIADPNFIQNVKRAVELWYTST